MDLEPESLTIIPYGFLKIAHYGYDSMNLKSYTWTIIPYGFLKIVPNGF